MKKRTFCGFLWLAWFTCGPAVLLAQPLLKNFATTNTPSATTNAVRAAVAGISWPASAVTNLGSAGYSNAGSFVASATGRGTNLTLVNATNTGLAIQGDSGSGTMTLGRFSTYGIHPYFDHIQYRTTAVGGHLFQSLENGYYQFTVGWDGNAGGGKENIPRSYWENSKQVDGATITAFFPATGGSGAALNDLPVRGPEIWQNQKMPAIVITSRGDGTEGNNLTNCTEVNMKRSVPMFVTNGLAALLTNAGVALVYEAENGWLDQHRNAAGLLQWNTNRWPMQASSHTNVANYLRTNGFEGWLMMYADTIVAPTNNTEVLINPVVGNSSAYWFYPGNGNPFGSTESQPIVTPRDVVNDVSTFYSWGFGGFTVQDNKNLERASSQEQLRRMLAYASLYPIIVNNQAITLNVRKTYRDAYPSARHGLVLNYLVGSLAAGGTNGGVAFPPAAEFDANGLALETLGDAPAVTATVLGRSIAALKPYLPAMTNWQSKTVHFIPQSDSLLQNTAWTATDWQHYFSMVAMFAANAWLTSPHYYFTNAAFQAGVTNAQMLAIWQDVSRARVNYAAVGPTTAVFGRQLADGGAAIWFVNESSTASNLSVSLPSLGLKAAAYPVTNIWSSSYVSNSTAAITVSVAATNSVLLRLGVPVARGATTNNMVLQCPNGGTFLFRVDNAGTLSAVTNTTGF